MKHALRVAKRLAPALVLLVSIGCRPKNQNMLVAYVEGDVFLPDLRPGAWNSGATVECEIASRTSTLPDRRGDLLLCGDKTQFAWSQTWLRADIKTKIYSAASHRVVNFHSSGHLGGPKDSHRFWRCRSTSDNIDCE
jgi:hypothetical protein